MNVMKTSIAMFVLLLGVTFASSLSPMSPAGTDRGEEWLSWSPELRETFVSGFMIGYDRGIINACNSANALFEVGKPHRLGDDPSARCEAKVDSYSKESATYAAEVTDFYSTYPQYRNIPYIYLFSFLGDAHFKTAEQLYEMAATGQIRTNF